MTHDEAFALSPIKQGQSYTFDYPIEFTLHKSLPEYCAHRGAQVTVLRPCTEVEADILWDDLGNGPEIVDRMFLIEATDGWQGLAYESELVSHPKAARP